MGVRPYLNLAIQAFGRRLNAFKNAVVTGTYTNQSLGPRLICPSCDFRRKAAAIVGVIERYVVNKVATISQFGRKMTHCREEKSKANFVLGNISRYFLDLHHQDGVLGSVKIIKSRGICVELISEYQNQIAGFFFVCSAHFYTSLSGLHDF
jgi:hypothetical protein